MIRALILAAILTIAGIAAPAAAAPHHTSGLGCCEN